MPKTLAEARQSFHEEKRHIPWSFPLSGRRLSSIHDGTVLGWANFWLGVGMVVMVVAMMMPSGGKGRAGTNQHQKRGEDKLLHGVKRSTIPAARNAPEVPGIKSTTAPPGPFRGFPGKGVH